MNFSVFLLIGIWRSYYNAPQWTPQDLIDDDKNNGDGNNPLSQLMWTPIYDVIWRHWDTNFDIQMNT